MISSRIIDGRRAGESSEMSLSAVAKDYQRKYCREDIILLRSPLSDANLPYQEPDGDPQEIEYSFKGGVNPRRGKISGGSGGSDIIADYSIITTIEAFQDSTGIPIDPDNLDWLTYCRLRIRGALCSIVDFHIMGNRLGIPIHWITLFAQRENI